MNVSVFLTLLVAITIGQAASVAGQDSEPAKQIEEYKKKVEDLQKRVTEAEAALKTEVPARQKTEVALPKKRETPHTWDGWWREGLREVLWPILRLLGIAGILLFAVLKLDFTSVLKGEQWSERTILALAIVLTFCGAVLLSLPESIPQELKEIVLVVLGFYFGSSRGDRERVERAPALANTPETNQSEAAGTPATKQPAASITGETNQPGGAGTSETTQPTPAMPPEAKQ